VAIWNSSPAGKARLRLRQELMMNRDMRHPRRLDSGEKTREEPWFERRLWQERREKCLFFWGGGP
jgi:hypothetical protein